MGPYLGPVASALLAAVVAGLVLGVVRLGTLSLAWWRARPGRGARGSAAALDPAPAPLTGPAPPVDPAAFRRGALAIALLAWLGALLLALGVPVEARAASPTAIAPLVATALQALVFGLGAASVTAVLERALGIALLRFGAGTGSGPAPGLPLTEFWRTARAALPGHERSQEPLGAGLATSLVFASAIGAWSVLLAVLAGHPPPAMALVVGVALASLPLAYAVAADRTPDPARARRRQDTALRQLLAAPIWALSLLLLAVPDASPIVRTAALAGLALVAGATLPGTVPPGSAFLFPTRGDADAPDAAVRLFTDAAHYGWLSAWAFGLALAITAPRPAPAILAGTTLGLLLLLLIARRVPRPSRFARSRSVRPETA